MYPIHYEGEKEKIDINGANVGMSLYHYYYIDKNDQDKQYRRANSIR